MAQLMPLPLIVSCFSKIQTGFTFLVPVHPGSPGQRAVRLNGCVGDNIVKRLHMVTHATLYGMLGNYNIEFHSVLDTAQ